MEKGKTYTPRKLDFRLASIPLPLPCFAEALPLAQGVGTAYLITGKQHIRTLIESQKICTNAFYQPPTNNKEKLRAK